jgi:hypothetical protein
VHYERLYEDYNMRQEKRKEKVRELLREEQKMRNT